MKRQRDRVFRTTKAYPRVVASSIYLTRTNQPTTRDFRVPTGNGSLLFRVRRPPAHVLLRILAVEYTIRPGQNESRTFRATTTNYYVLYTDRDERTTVVTTHVVYTRPRSPPVIYSAFSNKGNTTMARANKTAYLKTKESPNKNDANICSYQTSCARVDSDDRRR